MHTPSTYLDGIDTTITTGSGGIVHVVGQYTVHEFTSSGHFTPSKTANYEIFMVGPGGNGSGAQPEGYGGGGAGGEVLYAVTTLRTGTPYTCSIGTYANNTTFNGIIARSGSNGGNGTPSVAGEGGDSINYQGGGSANLGAGGGASMVAIGGTGYDGGSTSNRSLGAIGIANSWTGVTKIYGAGGGGATISIAGVSDEGYGGSSEAGNGAVGTQPNDIAGTNAANNSGAGGGGSLGNVAGGDGGTGLILVRYKTS